MTDRLRTVPIDSISLSGENMRFDAPEVEDLAASIRDQGLLQPLVVTPDLVLVCGHRRLAACRRAGMGEVDVIVRRFASDDALLTAMLAENVHRRNLSAIEEAAALKKMVERGQTQVEVAKLIGKSDFYVSTRLALLTLSEAIQHKIHVGEMTMTEGVAMVEERRRHERGQRAPETRDPQPRWQMHYIDKLLRWIEGGRIPQHLPELMKKLELLRRSLNSLASVSEDGKEIQVVKRVCAHVGCPSILSRFNRSKYCGAHEGMHAPGAKAV